MRAPAVLRSIQRGARLAQVRAQAPQSPSLLPSLRPRDDCLGARSGGIPGGTLGPLTEDSPCNSSWRFKQAAEGEEWSLGWPWLSRARSLGVNSVGAPEAASRVALSQRHFAARSAMAPPLSVVLEGGGRVLSIQSHTVQVRCSLTCHRVELQPFIEIVAVPSNSFYAPPGAFLPHGTNSRVNVMKQP